MKVQVCRKITEIYHLAGKATGIVTTTRLTHASPAAAYSNSVGRWYETYVPTECNGIQKPLNQQFIDNSKYFNVTFVA